MIRRHLGLLLAFGALGAATDVGATQITYDPSVVFTGSPLSGSAPYLQIQISDDGTNRVLLTITAENLTSGENVSGVYLNDSDFASALTFTLDGGLKAASITDSSKCCKADGDGFYDILLSYGTGKDGIMNSPLNSTSTYLITGPGLTASMFSDVSDHGGGTGQYYAAAHVQNTGGGSGSSWIGATGPAPVPLPGAAWLLLSGFGVLGLLRRARQSAESGSSAGGAF